MIHCPNKVSDENKRPLVHPLPLTSLMGATDSRELPATKGRVIWSILFNILKYYTLSDLMVVDVANIELDESIGNQFNVCLWFLSGAWMLRCSW